MGLGRKNAIEDFEIILDILAGNPNAYAHIVRKYAQRIHGYCLSLLTDPMLAEDASQEIFIKAYRALEQFQARASFSTWLYRIAANHCKDLLRKTTRHKTESWEELLEKEGEKVEALFSAHPGDLQAIEQADLITKLFSHLSENSRSILALREWHGLSYAELAKTLDCSLDAVKTRLKRAR